MTIDYDHFDHNAFYLVTDRSQESLEAAVREVYEAANVGCRTAAEKARTLADEIEEWDLDGLRDETQETAQNLADALTRFADDYESAWDALDDALEDLTL